MTGHVTYTTVVSIFRSTMSSGRCLTFSMWCILAARLVSAFAPSQITSRSRPLLPKIRPLALHHPLVNPLQPYGIHSAVPTKGIELAGLVYDETSRAFDAWEWTAGLGAPAALVAGAVLVTLSETREQMQPKSKDKRWIRLSKQAFRFLIMSSFALEVISIFVSTVTGEFIAIPKHLTLKLGFPFLFPHQWFYRILSIQTITCDVSFSF